MIHPDASVRRDIISVALHGLLPRDYDGYQIWRGRLAKLSTRAVLGLLEELRWFHTKFLLLEGNDAGAANLLKPRKPKPVRDEARPSLPFAAVAAAEETQAAKAEAPVAAGPASDLRLRRDPETSDDEPEWVKYGAITGSLEEFRQLKREAQKKAKALAETEARKKALKDAKERSGVTGAAVSAAKAAAESEAAQDDVTPHPVLSLARNAYSTFEKLFLLKGTGASRVLGSEAPLSDYDRLTFEDDVEIRASDFENLVHALNGTAQSGKGGHKKAKISCLSFVLNGRQVELIDLAGEFSGVASQTVTYTPQTPFLPPYQIEQIREKFLALGYSPRTVISAR